MARSIARIITSLTLGLALAAAPVVSATAAQAADVTISKIGTKKAKKGKTVTIKPVVKTAGDKVKVTSKTLTVTKGKKVVAQSVASAKLKIGTYKVTQNVWYKVHVGKSKTIKKGTWAMADCVVDKVLKDKSIKATIVTTCVSDEFPGTHTFTVDLEWEYCSVEDYLKDRCTFDEWWDDESWWEGQTTDKKLNFDTSSSDYLSPEVGEEFTAFIDPKKGSWTFRDDNWVEKTKSRTQTLKVKKK